MYVVVSNAFLIIVVPFYPTEPNILTLESFEKQNGDTINIIDSIGGEYMDFGIHLLNDDTGTIMADIANQPTDTSANIKRVIVTRWLKGEGKRPVSWKTLTKVFDTMKLKVLAKDIREALGSGELLTINIVHA